MTYANLSFGGVATGSCEGGVPRSELVERHGPQRGGAETKGGSHCEVMCVGNL